MEYKLKELTTTVTNQEKVIINQESMINKLAKQTTDIVDIEKDDDSVPGSDKSTCTTRPKTLTSVQMETETTNDTTPLNEQRQSIKHPKIIKLNDSSNVTTP
ncbi:unnamed protein product [Rhizophagus irregularis]|nr:unnamed protein product [Rhizophagus irregularis]CAB5395104.1 unnamed protein product [Rhizophagus irregularis]